MVKFLKPNKVSYHFQGKYVAQKAVIVSSFDEETRGRPYGHCLVAGVTEYPKSCVKTFIKFVNYNHIMPTRYTLNMDLKDVVNADVLRARDKKLTTTKENKARLEERFKTGKNRWFFTR